MKSLDIPNKDRLIDVMRKNQIQFAALFGSRAKNIAKKDSDYDILIEFSPDARIGLFKYQEIEDEISSTLGGKVDLVTVNGIDKHVKSEVLRTMRIIYGRRSER